ncbi:phosphatase PAP2 family protein [Solimonas marina]|uniref:undecaprenyl-diphosphate phosphatase n=1 Tax=Solimonas marina TaxID=2714601 RepID=A0A969WB04_9GAMM|nr:phosphatase PAP2 family protein [Solimonas marina]NKF23667.1 phosphatase PAP2 family protein [Solimonas marina]
MSATLLHRLQQPRPTADDHRWLLIVAGQMTVFAAALIAAGGYHIGFHWLNDAARPLSAPLLQNITQTGDSLVMLNLFLLLIWRYPQAVWHAVLAALIATLLSHGVKIIAHLPRPAGALAADSFRLIGPAWHRNSFPSGHTVTAFVGAGVLACATPSIAMRAVLILMAMAIGVSRVAVGAHWPVDVLTGAAIGLLSVWLGLCAMRRCRWGLRLQGHLLIAALLAGCAIADVVRMPAYPDALWMVRTISCLGLASALWRYGFATRGYAITGFGWQRRAGGASV